jgi:hypothetical protein
MSKCGFGILTIALGHERYAKQTEILSLSLKKNMPGVAIAVVTDNPRLAAFADFIIPPLSGLPIGVLQKVYLDHYTPFEETLFIDSDCIVTRPFHEELREISKFDFSPIVETITSPDGADDYLYNLPEALKMVGGKAFPKFNGGVYFFRGGELSSSVFTVARDIHGSYRDYGIKTFDQSGPNEETIFGLALSKLGVGDLYIDFGRLMRTPTGLKGTIEIEPLGGGCSFERIDGWVSPAICHFAGAYILSSEYRLAAYSLVHNRPVKDIDLKARLSVTLDSFLARMNKFLEYRVHGVKKRALALWRRS